MDDLIVYDRINKDENLLSLAATRTLSQGAVSGFGNLFTFDFVVLEEMNEPVSITIIDAALSSLTSIDKEPNLSYGFEVITSNELEKMDLPKEITLMQNYPNPFNPSTAIQFAVPSQSDVKIQVFNSIGQLVANLTDKPYAAGNYTVQFDASHLTSGMYFYRLTTGSVNITKKMVLIK